MSIKTATLVGAGGAVAALLLQLISLVDEKFYVSNIQTLKYAWLAPSVCYLVFFAVLFTKQSKTLPMGDDIGNLLGIQQDSNPNRGGSIPYAPGIIRQFADRLYARAGFIVFVYTVIGLIVGGVVGVALKVGFSNDLAAWIVGTAIVAVAFLLGQERAFHLRLQAQLALCQVQIEENTRKSPG